MGRGLGPLQQRILGYLASPEANGRRSTIELAQTLFAGAARTRAQEVSLRRAIAALRQRGLVRTSYGYEDGAALCLHVWRVDHRPVHPPSVERRRWKDQDEAMLKLLAAITHEEVEAWLAQPKGVRGYDRTASEWRQNRWHASPLVPYQMAVQRIVAALGGRDRRGRLTPSTSRAIRHALRRLARRRLIALRYDDASLIRTYSAVRYAPANEFVWQERKFRRSLDEPLRVLVRRDQPTPRPYS